MHAAWAVATPTQACTHADEAHVHLSAVLPASHQCSPPATQDLPVPVEEQSRDTLQPSLGNGHHLCANAQREVVPVRCGGLAQPHGLGLATFQYDGRAVLRGCPARGYCPLGKARHFQHRSGQPRWIQPVVATPLFSRYLMVSGLGKVE